MTCKQFEEQYFIWNFQKCSRYNPKFNTVPHTQFNNQFCCSNSHGNSDTKVLMTREEVGMGGSNQDKISYTKHGCLEESKTCKVKLECSNQEDIKAMNSKFQTL
jgi:hypothetical protein